MTGGGCRGEVWRRRRSQSLRAEAGPGPQLLEKRELLARPLGPRHRPKVALQIGAFNCKYCKHCSFHSPRERQQSGSGSEVNGTVADENLFKLAVRQPWK